MEELDLEFKQATLSLLMVRGLWPTTRALVLVPVPVPHPAWPGCSAVPARLCGPRRRPIRGPHRHRARRRTDVFCPIVRGVRGRLSCSEFGSFSLQPRRSGAEVRFQVSSFRFQVSGLRFKVRVRSARIKAASVGSDSVADYYYHRQKF